MTEITLECGCVQYYATVPPKKHDLLYCLAHKKLTGIRQPPGLWEIMCLECRYVRHSLGQLTARTRATKHMCSAYHSVQSWRLGDYHGTCEISKPEKRSKLPPRTVPF